MAIDVCVSAPLVAVIVTLNMPGLLLVHERFAVATGGTIALVGVIAKHDRPVGKISERDIVPVNPLTLLRVIVETEEFRGLAVGPDAVIVKSIMLKRSGVER